MATYMFDIKEHEETGVMGCAMRGRPWAEPTNGMGAAHDVLEHFPNDKGTVEEEMMALGASLFVRGEAYYDATNNKIISPATHIAGEFLSQCYYMVQANGLRLLAPVERLDATEEDPIPPEVREWVFEAVEEGAANVRTDWEDETYGVPSWIVDTAEWPKIMNYMFKGWLRAQRRFKTMANRGWKQEELPYLFLQMERAIDSALNRADEGCAVRVDFNWNSGEMHVWLCYVDHFGRTYEKVEHT